MLFEAPQRQKKKKEKEEEEEKDGESSRCLCRESSHYSFPGEDGPASFTTCLFTERVGNKPSPFHILSKAFLQGEEQMHLY